MQALLPRATEVLCVIVTAGMPSTAVILRGVARILRAAQATFPPPRILGAPTRILGAAHAYPHNLTVSTGGVGVIRPEAE